MIGSEFEEQVKNVFKEMSSDLDTLVRDTLEKTASDINEADLKEYGKYTYFYTEEDMRLYGSGKRDDYVWIIEEHHSSRYIQRKPPKGCADLKWQD